MSYGSSTGVQLSTDTIVDYFRRKNKESQALATQTLALERERLELARTEATERREVGKEETAGVTLFHQVWKSCLPHIQFMTPRTDVCFKCEAHRQAVQNAVDEESKAEALQCFTAHICGAKKEREFYQEATKKAHAELQNYNPPAPPPFAACSQPLKAIHYTFDFAQQVSLPHLARQPGPLYFKTPRKIQLFGVCNEGTPKQTNYLLDEQDAIGPNGTKSHGANTVVSLLHHFFTVHGHGEECVLHADNCAGQNKNRTVINYLAWRVALGMHTEITLPFMIAGHTRYLVDGCFGLLKRAYRRADIFTMEQLAEVVKSSAVCNVFESGSNVNWYAFTDQYFSKVKGISKLQHFRFSANKKGTVSIRESVDSEWRDTNILKVQVEQLSQAVFPEMLPRGGMTAERQLYLYKEIRDFVPVAFKDIFCPPPGEDG